MNVIITNTDISEHDEILRLLMDERVRKMDGSDYNEDLIQLVFKYCPFNFTIRSDKNEIVGFSQLCPINVVYRTYEIAYHFKPEVWGKGYGTNVVPYLLNYAFNTLLASNIMAKEVSDSNGGSIRLLEKNGFLIQNHFPDKAKTSYYLTDEDYFKRNPLTIIP